ncbi:SDR family oxidoreductase [Synechococcales cyanobacterium C]|uniref:SDR family oxidoreductase n=1 Tax=Petrachloros mirabilis ULC683 TaxID=2781853 RepID=A0A8K2A1K2_9CYAN|nr:SDR family oxidoreductase [Petrachloros mirabilis]NCJ07772.1 SDR family oxidoreductase [Petrachloros mirabilis ULC683]
MTSQLHQCALVTGATRGIGRATALALAQIGLKVVLVGRSQADLEAAQQDIEAQGGRAESVQLDLAAVDAIADKFQHLDETLGPIDLLINNAGMGYTAPLLETPLTDWQAVLNLNLTSPFQCIQGVLPGMKTRQFGTIINVSSVAGRQAFSQWGAYCASKFGLMALTQTLAQEVRADGIRVMALCPGSVNTSLWDSDTVQADFDRSAMLTPEIVAQTLVQMVQMPPTAVIEELVLMPHGGTF